MRASILRSDRQLFVSYEIPTPSENASEWTVYAKERPIRFNNETIGYIVLELDSSEKLEVFYDGMLKFLLFILFFLGASILVSQWITKQFSRPFKVLNNAMASIGEDKNYKITINSESHMKEIEELTQNFNNLLGEVCQRDEELKELNFGLEQKVQQKTKELRDAQEKLVEEAHFAGMAEVASGTVHNIGNVLTSIISETSIIHEKIKHAPLDKFKMVNQKLNGLPIDCDEEEAIKKFYGAIESAISKTFSDVKEKIERITKHTNICTEIIHFQQNLASQRTMTETTSIADLVELFMTIKGTYISKHDLHVRILGEQQSQVKVHRSKMLSILINLLHNATESMESQNVDDKLIEISAAKRDGEVVVISFTDSGQPVEDSIARNLFRWGFTTKKKGHGFGLHSCYNYMQEMDGDIRFTQDEGRPCFELHLKEAG